MEIVKHALPGRIYTVEQVLKLCEGYVLSFLKGPSIIPKNAPPQGTPGVYLNYRYSEDDPYSPQYYRGKGHKKEGWCPHCPSGSWHKLKQSGYHYHVQYHHGYSASAKTHIELPDLVKLGREEGSKNQALEWLGWCSSCNLWVQLLGRWSKKNKGQSNKWFKHMVKVRHPALMPIASCTNVATRSI